MEVERRSMGEVVKVGLRWMDACARLGRVDFLGVWNGFSHRRVM